MKTPDYVLNEPHEIKSGWHDVKVLEPGTFIRPVEPIYLPKHILDSNDYKYFNKLTEVFCWTRYGFVVLPKHKIRRV